MKTQELRDRLLNPDPNYQDGVADGRNDAAQTIRSMIWNTLGKHVEGIGDTAPGVLSIEMALSDVVTKLTFYQQQIGNRNEALANRDELDRLICQLLELAMEQHCTHGERKGMLMLIKATLNRYIGQRNGTDPIKTLPELSSGNIPF